MQTDDINLMTRDQREDVDFRRTVELRLENEDSNCKIQVDALLDSGTLIYFIKEHLIPREYLISNYRSHR